MSAVQREYHAHEDSLSGVPPALDLQLQLHFCVEYSVCSLCSIGRLGIRHDHDRCFLWSLFQACSSYTDYRNRANTSLQIFVIHDKGLTLLFASFFVHAHIYIGAGLVRIWMSETPPLQSLGWLPAYLNSFRRDIFLSESFFMTFATAISKSSCIRLPILDCFQRCPTLIFSLMGEMSLITPDTTQVLMNSRLMAQNQCSLT